MNAQGKKRTPKGRCGNRNKEHIDSPNAICPYKQPGKYFFIYLLIKNIIYVDIIKYAN